jgi:hypothetical protein
VFPRAGSQDGRLEGFEHCASCGVGVRTDRIQLLLVVGEPPVQELSGLLLLGTRSVAHVTPTLLNAPGYGRADGLSRWCQRAFPVASIAAGAKGKDICRPRPDLKLMPRGTSGCLPKISRHAWFEIGPQCPHRAPYPASTSDVIHAAATQRGGHGSGPQGEQGPLPCCPLCWISWVDAVVGGRTGVADPP